MQCPNDQTTLAMTDRQGIEIDYCPTCRGVWLDKGELDKLIAGSEPQQHQEPRQQDQRQQHDRPVYNDDQSHYKKKHKKESFLGDIFDF